MSGIKAIQPRGEQVGKVSGSPKAANKSAVHSAAKPRKPTIRSCASDDGIAPKPVLPVRAPE